MGDVTPFLRHRDEVNNAPAIRCARERISDALADAAIGGKGASDNERWCKNDSDRTQELLLNALRSGRIHALAFVGIDGQTGMPVTAINAGGEPASVFQLIGMLEMLRLELSEIASAKPDVPLHRIEPLGNGETQE